MFSKVCLLTVLLAVAHSLPAPGIYGESAISYTSLPVQQKQLISYAQPQLQTIAIQKSQPLLTQIAHPAPQLISAPLIQKQVLQPQIIQAAPQIIQAAPQKIEVESYDPNPQYSYKYGVTDPHTGDSKSAEESLVNGVVHGSYTLAEADGSIRKVTYTADKINGFNAVVERSGGAKQVAVVQPTITKVLQPALTKLVSAPQISYGGYH